jgi:Ribbon-helix-helix domain
MNRQAGAYGYNESKRIMTSLYIEPEVHAALKALSQETPVPIAVDLREAVTDLLANYNVKASPPRAKK